MRNSTPCTLYAGGGGEEMGYIQQEANQAKLCKENTVSSPSQTDQASGALELITPVFTGGKVGFPGTETLLP